LLKAIIKSASEADEARDTELEQLAEKVAEWRNEMVHPKPRAMTENGFSRQPRILEDTADRALEDFERIIFLLKRVKGAWPLPLGIV
jgi:hypothetical protein